MIFMLLLAFVPLVGIIPAGADTPWIRLPSPAPSDQAALADVSCVTATSCVAVGHYWGTRKQNSLVVRTTDGITWTRIASPSPGRYYNKLDALSCVSAVECTAVGAFSTLAVDAYQPLVLRTTNGTDWDWVPTDRFGHQSWLVGVSCTSATRCRAVGTGGFLQIIIGTTNGVTWLPQPTPVVESEMAIRSIDCVSNVRCTAVGSYKGGNGRLRTLVLRTDDGRTWEQRASLNPAPKIAGATLDDVSCGSASTCTAVGTVDPIGLVNRAFILRSTDGETWTRSATPDGSRTILRGVSCSSAITCTAIGYRANDGAIAILRTINGTSWVAVDSGAARPGREAAEVSCALPTACVAVGLYRPAPPVVSRPLVLKET